MIEERIAIIEGAMQNDDGEICIKAKFGQKIVRCKDCKHYMQTSCPMTGTWATDEDFCSFGEGDHVNDSV